jgi:5'-3' exonuclease
MSTIYLIDASPYIFRAYYSIPNTMRSPDGMTVNAVYGYTDFLIQLLKREFPTHIAVAFDGSLTTSFRNDIYPEYKAQRELPPAELEAQMDACWQVTEAMGMAAFIDDRYEADDILGTLTVNFVRRNHQVVVVSNDKDLAQLVNDRVSFWDFARDRRFDAQGVTEHFGVRPDQIVDLLALMGDSVDNIPGVPGIGKKTAVALLQKFGNLEELYGNIESVEQMSLRGAASIKEKLIEGRERAEISKRLATIVLDAPVETDLHLLSFEGASQDKIDPLFEQLGFGGIKDRIPLFAKKIASA